MNRSPPGFSVHGIIQQEYWCGLPILPPGDLPDLETEPVCPALQVDSLPLSHQESFMAALKSTTDHVAHTEEMYCPTILEAESPRSSYSQGWFLLRPLSLACKWLPSPSIFL